MRFIETINARSAGELLEPSEQIRNILPRMDGSKLFTLLVHPVPDDFDIHVSDPRPYSEEYLQCAGAADRMVVEVRRWEGDDYGHYALARPGADPSGVEGTVPWAEYQVTAFEHELFDAEQAIGVFEYYVENEASIPADVALRRLDLS